MSDETMLEEAINATRLGEKERARDLLTRLLRKNQNNPDYWYWMSAVVPTQREQIFCLENLLRLDPQNKFARRGLMVLGAIPQEESLVPSTPTRSKPYQVKTLEIKKQKILGAKSIFRLGGFALLFGALIGLVLFGIYGVQQFTTIPTPQPTPNFKLTAAQVEYVTLTPSPTSTPTETPVIIGTPTLGQPTPLEKLLKATYTPTAMYVTTPHPEIEAYRSSLFAKQRQDWGAAIDYLLQAIDIQPSAADLHFYLGEAYLQTNQPQKALNAFTTALQLNDKFGPAYVGRAVSRLALDPKADVRRDFENAILFSPDYGELYIERARYYILNQAYGEALADLVTAEKILPASSQIPLLRSQVYLAQGEYELAKEQAALANQRDLTLLPAYLYLGQAYMGLQEFRDAAIQLDKYITYAPGDQQATYLLCQAYLEAEEFSRAMFIADRLVAANQEDAKALYLRGLIQLRSGNFVEALNDLNAANRVDRGEYPINLALGEVLIKIDSFGNAYFQLSDTLTLAKTTQEQAQVYYLRAVALAKLEQYKAAQNDLKIILDFDPTQVDSKTLLAAQELQAEISEKQAQAQETPLPGSPVVTPKTTSTPGP